MLRFIGRWFHSFCNFMDSISPPDWRVQKHEDGLWYVEWEHMDQGWVTEGPGYKTMIEAAAAGRKKYARKK